MYSGRSMAGYASSSPSLSNMLGSYSSQSPSIPIGSGYSFAPSRISQPYGASSVAFSSNNYAAKASGYQNGRTHPIGSYSSANSTANNHYHLVPQQQHDFAHTSLLASSRPMTQFIGDASLVQEYVEEAFEKVVGQPFPNNLKVVVGKEEEIRAYHGGTWSPGILGFSINRQGFGQNEIYIKSNNLDVLMLTIGHEIGHVMSPTLPSVHDEEAKAFAFELAWVEALIEHNIAGLDECYLPTPANNGLHDRAFQFVKFLINKGMSAIDVFTDLVFERVSMLQSLEWRVQDYG